ncbi:hypothetical protein B0T17DRAFT_133879 [Bombardia bombarda]|uniref:Uncharacterized protein n=1 Tax=Bombardia bombarda TaxID=252184 RepID=A0AA39U136_9PEZI|nr:hypothetical protein B0T17DRAFT_133879 [Bombardia bombarda]
MSSACIFGDVSAVANAKTTGRDQCYDVKRPLTHSLMSGRAACLHPISENQSTSKRMMRVSSHSSHVAGTTARRVQNYGGVFCMQSPTGGVFQTGNARTAFHFIHVRLTDMAPRIKEPEEFIDQSACLIASPMRGVLKWGEDVVPVVEITRPLTSQQTFSYNFVRKLCQETLSGNFVRNHQIRDRPRPSLKQRKERFTSTPGPQPSPTVQSYLTRRSSVHKHGF